MESGYINLAMNPRIALRSIRATVKAKKVAWMKRSGIRVYQSRDESPDYALLHPVYGQSEESSLDETQWNPG